MGVFSLFTPLSAVVEALRPFDFLVSGAQLAFYVFVISSISHMFITSNVFVVSRITPKKWTFKKMKAHFDVFLLYACEFIRP